MELLPTKAPKNNFWFECRWSLVQSMIVLKDFKRAISVLEKLVYCCSESNKQKCIKLLEIIRKSENLPEEDDTPNSNEVNLTKNSNNFNPVIKRYEILNKKNVDDLKLELKKHVCFSCNMTFKSFEELQIHCETLVHEHTMIEVASNWIKKFTSGSMTANTPNLCGNNTCSNGVRCVDAHSIQEFNEWKERFEFSIKKLQRSNETSFCKISYQDLALNKKWTDDDWKLNEKQREAVAAIVAPRKIHLPPILIIGPFGTGKTYTLAQAVRYILSEEDTKILICTNSNSAADLYINKYLHPYVESGLIEATPLRIYNTKHWVSTVNSTVLQYCLTDVENGIPIFKTPQLNDILRHRIIVITSNISSHLSSIGLPKGYFTHILLDKVENAVECETIMPWALASEETRIVLAGDHMQLSPEIFPQFAEKTKFHISFLRQIYEVYPAEYPCKIEFGENYRAHKDIVEFMSALFYDGKLLSSGKQPKHHKFYPLTFFTALGEEDINSTGYYNSVEVYEVVDRVADLKKNWPECWGKFDEYSIGIITPYLDQVCRIRLELKRRKLMDISVERNSNIEGKQFRVVFLSTVRTSRTCIFEEEETGNLSDYDYSFFSNEQLFTTAVTRAQSLVAVVGDPVSLCSIGKCRYLWKYFIEICNENSSFFGFSWQDLNSLLLAVEMKKKYKLNPLSTLFVPQSHQADPSLQLPFCGVQSSEQTIDLPQKHQNRVYVYNNTSYELPRTNTLSTQLASCSSPPDVKNTGLNPFVEEFVPCTLDPLASKIVPTRLDPEASKFVPKTLQAEPNSSTLDPVASKFVPRLDPEASKFVPKTLQAEPNSSTLDPVASKFVPRLDPEASEFVPKTLQAEPNSSTLDPVASKFVPRLDPEASEFVPKTLQAEPNSSTLDPVASKFVPRLDPEASEFVPKTPKAKPNLQLRRTPLMRPPSGEPNSSTLDPVASKFVPRLDPEASEFVPKTPKAKPNLQLRRTPLMRPPSGIQLSTVSISTIVNHNISFNVNILL